jgi:ATP-dependent RNA helicase DeaD
VHDVYLVRDDKLGVLMRMLEVENPESAIIFCNTKVETERVAEALERQGFAAAWLNGDLPQSDREGVMRRTREGKLRFLVATDVAARGIDISHLTHVINFDFPESAERYVHRTGRTGRAGRTGTAIALVAPQDIGHLYLLRLTYKIRPVERQLPTSGERKTREETDLVQMLAEAFGATPRHPDDLAVARRLLTHDDAERIVAGLVRDHLGERPEAIEQAAAARRSKTVVTAEPKPSADSRAETKASPRVEPASQAAKVAPPPRPPAVEPVQSPRVKPPRSARASTIERRGLGVRWSEEPQTVPEDARQASGSDAIGAPQASGPDAYGARQASGPDAYGARQAFGNDPTFAEIFVNIGRRDGVTASDFQRVLAQLGGITETEVGPIRIRDRSSFVSIRRETLEKALATINGATIGGKVAQAEVARARSSGTSSTNDG